MNEASAEQSLPPPLTGQTVLRRAWPLVFANAAVPLAGAADTFVLGLAGNATDIGGVALGAAILSIFLWGFIFLRMGTTGLVAQAIGGGSERDAQRVLVRAVVAALVLGAAVVLLREAIASVGLGLMGGGPEVAGKAAGYLTARALGAPAALAVYALTGWLIGTGNSAATFAVAGIFSLTNIGVEFWFVLGLHMGPVGVGIATAIADCAGLLVALAVVGRSMRGRGGWRDGVFDLSKLFEAGAMRRLFDVNVNLMIRTWFLILGFTWFVNAGARQGAATLAGNQVLLQVISIWAFVLDAFAYVAEAESGRAFGAKSVSALRRAVRLTGGLALASGGVFAVLTFVCGAPLLSQLVADASARDAAHRVPAVLRDRTGAWRTRLDSGWSLHRHHARGHAAQRLDRVGHELHPCQFPARATFREPRRVERVPVLLRRARCCPWLLLSAARSAHGLIASNKLCVRVFTLWSTPVLSGRVQRVGAQGATP